MTRSRCATVLACGLLVTVAACPSLNSPVDQPIVWQTHLVPGGGYPGFTGQAALAAQLKRTDAGIGISGAQPAAIHTWRIRIGSCAMPGDGIGPESDYPQLVVSDAGDASAEMQIGHRLTADSTYYAEVRASPTDTTRVACGDFQVLQP